MISADILRSLELRAQDKGVKTSFTISPNILQNMLKESYQVRDVIQYMLELPTGSLDFLTFMEEKGMTEEQCRIVMRKQLDEVLEEIKQINQIQQMHNTFPTYDFVQYLGEVYINAAHTTNETIARAERFKVTINRQKFIIAGLIIFGLFTGTVLYSSSLSSSSTNSTISNSTSYTDDTADKDADLIPFPYPENGAPLYNYCDPSERVAPLTIKTRGDDAYYVKLVSRHNPNHWVAFFVRPNQTAEYLMPLGDFELRYASGRVWYGSKFFFGSDTVYSKANDILSFSLDGDYYSGHTITLYPVSNGNMSTKEISEEYF